MITLKEKILSKIDVNFLLESFTEKDLALTFSVKQAKIRFIAQKQRQAAREAQEEFAEINDHEKRSGQTGAWTNSPERKCFLNYIREVTNES